MIRINILYVECASYINKFDTIDLNVLDVDYVIFFIDIDLVILKINLKNMLRDIM